MGRFILWRCFAFACILISVRSDSDNKAKVSELRDKYSIAEVVRDKDHIKKDLSTVLNLMDLGEISERELVFFFLRIHDFDDNGKLDGLEIMTSFKHMGPTEDFNHSTSTKIESGVDAYLANHDFNKDGFIDFSELVSDIKPRTSTSN